MSELVAALAGLVLFVIVVPDEGAATVAAETDATLCLVLAFLGSLWCTA